MAFLVSVASSFPLCIVGNHHPSLLSGLVWPLPFSLYRQSSPLCAFLVCIASTYPIRIVDIAPLSAFSVCIASSFPLYCRQYSPLCTFLVNIASTFISVLWNILHPLWLHRLIASTFPLSIDSDPPPSVASCFVCSLYFSFLYFRGPPSDNYLTRTFSWSKVIVPLFFWYINGKLLTLYLIWVVSIV